MRTETGFTAKFVFYICTSNLYTCTIFLSLLCPSGHFSPNHVFICLILLHSPSPFDPLTVFIPLRAFVILKKYQELVTNTRVCHYLTLCYIVNWCAKENGPQPGKLTE